MEDRGIRLDRARLYDLIWSKPATRVAEELGISDVALGKICRKLRVPKPGRGYWAALSAGRQPQRARLPQIPPSEVVLLPEDRRSQTRKVVPRAEAIVVRQVVNEPDPLVESARRKAAKTEPDYAGMLTVGGATTLGLSCSQSQLDRALLIADTLIKVLRSRGHAVHGVGSRAGSFEVGIEGERLTVTLREKVSRTEIRPKPADSYASRFAWKPAGRLGLRIEGVEYLRVRHRWSDGKVTRMESLVGEIVPGIEEAARAHRAHRLDVEEQKRRREVEHLAELRERWRREEEERERSALAQEAAKWLTAEEVRRYVKAVEEAAVGADRKSEALTAWIRWAIDAADQIDPRTRRVEM